MARGSRKSKRTCLACGVEFTSHREQDPLCRLCRKRRRRTPRIARIERTRARQDLS